MQTKITPSHMPLALASHHMYQFDEVLHQYSLFRPPQCKQDSVCCSSTEDKTLKCNKGEIPIDSVVAEGYGAGLGRIVESTGIELRGDKENGISKATIWMR
jgi:hypothetical protein